MRLKLDENLSIHLKPPLIAMGHDVLTTHDESLLHRPDTEVAAAAAAESRVLLTLDVGFGDLRKYPPGAHPGIVLFRPRSLGEITVNRALGSSMLISRSWKSRNRPSTGQRALYVASFALNSSLVVRPGSAVTASSRAISSGRQILGTSSPSSGRSGSRSSPSEPLDGPREFGDGDEIRLGYVPLRFRVLRTTAETTRTAARPRR